MLDKVSSVCPCAYRRDPALPLRETGKLEHRAAECMRSLSGSCAGTEAGSTQKALLTLLRPGGALAAAGAVIAYTTFQAQTERVAQFLTSHGIRAAAYHAGKHAKVCLTQLWALLGLQLRSCLAASCLRGVDDAKP